MIRLLIASPSEDVIDRASVLLDEVGDIEIVHRARTTNAVTGALSTDDQLVDVVVLHEDLGPLPVLDLARDLNLRFPHVGVALLAHEPSMDLMRASMSAGVRSVVRAPLTLSELQDAVTEANEWSQTVRTRLGGAGPAGTRSGRGGRMLTFVGAKGGVGTTTLATQAALEIARRDPERSVCLIDLDLQTGDVRGFLDLSHRRSITDLIDVASELTTAHLNDAMFAHASGVRILLPPTNGEDGEDLDGATTSRILGGIRARYDTVVVDVGSVLTEPASVAVELADDVVLVCTPDVVCLRGANRALSLWERLALRDEGIHTVLNRTDRSLEVQPSLAARVLGAPLLGTVVPDRTSDLEAAVNAGDPARLAGPVQAAMRELVDEVWREPEVTEPAPVGPLRQADLMRRVGSSERGALSVEFASLLLPVGAVLLLIWQLILAGYTVLWANHAAAEGARAYAVEGASHAGVVAAASADLHGHWRDRLIVTPVSATAPAVEVTIPVPLLVPGVGSPWHITTSAANVVEPQAAALPASDDVAEDGA